jgi:hypothetical protein
MPLDRPFLRTARQLADGSYLNSGNGNYVRHPAYAERPDKYIRSYLLIQRDMIDIFDYVSAGDHNLTAYSFRIHAIIIRACIEVEANFKAILKCNDYSKSSNFNMSDFLKVERTHRLSGYRIKVPYWDGHGAIRQPFLSFAPGPSGIGESPGWYRAYNATKHDRLANFEQATLGAMIDAVSGLAALLAAQFINEDFAPTSPGLALSHGDGDGSEDAIGGYFRIFFPTDWPNADRYGFNWQDLRSQADPFARHDYNA